MNTDFYDLTKINLIRNRSDFITTPWRKNLYLNKKN